MASQNNTLAIVGNSELKESDLPVFRTPYLNTFDSTEFVSKYVQDWVTKQLMIKKAEETVSFEDEEIEKKLLDYRYKLLLHELEKNYIGKHLQEKIEEKEIQDYYEKMSSNFVLENPILRVMYFKIPTNSPNLSEFEEMLKQYPEAKTSVAQYANQYAMKAFVDDSLWVTFDEIIKETPFTIATDPNVLMNKKGYLETSDNEFTHFIKILDIKRTGNIAPLKFVKEKISKIIMNKKRLSLKQQLVNEIYHEAEEKRLFKIYTN